MGKEPLKHFVLVGSFLFFGGNMKACSFFGHRDTPQIEELKEKVRKIIERLIVEEGVDTFLFGSRSKFDDLCHIVVTELKEKYPNIKRIYIRSQYSYLDKQYKDYLLKSYDNTTMPPRVEKAGRASYVERNQEMIDVSDFCIFYYNPSYLPPKRKYAKRDISDYQPKSGTALAFEYASQRKRGGHALCYFNLYIESDKNF
jgi:uncharacterized phage-like protein YoqJ